MFTFLLPAVVVCLFGQQIHFGLDFKGRSLYVTPYISHWDTHTTKICLDTYKVAWGGLQNETNCKKHN